MKFIHACVLAVIASEAYAYSSAEPVIERRAKSSSSKATSPYKPTSTGGGTKAPKSAAVSQPKGSKGSSTQKPGAPPTQKPAITPAPVSSPTVASPTVASPTVASPTVASPTVASPTAATLSPATLSPAPTGAPTSLQDVYCGGDFNKVKELLVDVDDYCVSVDGVTLTKGTAKCRSYKSDGACPNCAIGIGADVLAVAGGDILNQDTDINDNEEGPVTSAGSCNRAYAEANHTNSAFDESGEDCQKQICYAVEVLAGTGGGKDNKASLISTGDDRNSTINYSNAYVGRGLKSSNNTATATNEGDGYAEADAGDGSGADNNVATATNEGDGYAGADAGDNSGADNNVATATNEGDGYAESYAGDGLGAQDNTATATNKGDGYAYAEAGSGSGAQDNTATATNEGDGYADAEAGEDPGADNNVATATNEGDGYADAEAGEGPGADNNVATATNAGNSNATATAAGLQGNSNTTLLGSNNTATAESTGTLAFASAAIGDCGTATAINCSAVISTTSSCSNPQSTSCP